MRSGPTRIWLALAASLLFPFALGCAAQDDSSSPPDSTASAPPPSPSTGAPGNTPASATETGQAADEEKLPTQKPEGKKEGAKPGKNPVVVMETSMGTIKLRLDSQKAPVTVKNFLEYVSSGHYNGTIFHRVMEEFMIQGGGFTPDMKQKPTRDEIKNEAGNGLKNVRGTIAMARTSDPDSATAQFFINVVDNAGLDRANARDGVGYAVFGKVVSGMQVVDKIRAVMTEPRGGHENVPIDAVVIKSVKVEK